MYNLKNLKVLILEDNDLVKLTTNSLDINSPEISYKVIKKNEIKNGRIATALNNTDKITLVVQSGIVLNLKGKDLPNKSLIKKYHIGASRYGVFTDHPRLKMHYRWVAEDIHPNVLDLSIFVINPERWEKVPETDKEILNDKKILYMPRYMNHKDDILFKKDATAAVDAFNYGVLGEQAVAHNYVETIQKESINILEIYGYCFDKLQPYLKGVPKKSKDRIQHLIDQTTIKIKNTREKMHGNNIRNY
jgi:hypothetical protein